MERRATAQTPQIMMNHTANFPAKGLIDYILSSRVMMKQEQLNLSREISVTDLAMEGCTSGVRDDDLPIRHILYYNDWLLTQLL